MATQIRNRDLNVPQSDHVEWVPYHVTQELSDDILNVRNQFPLYSRQEKLHVLFSMLRVRKGELSNLKDNMNKIINVACDDEDEWVRLVANALKDFPAKQTLNTHLESVDGFEALLTYLGEKSKTDGVRFHPAEYMFMQTSALPSSLGSRPYLKASTTKLFTLSDVPGDTISSQKRMDRFESLLKEEKKAKEQAGSGDSLVERRSMSLPTSIPRMDSLVRPPRPMAPRNPASSSLFIPRQNAKRPIGQRPSFLRPSTTVRSSPTGPIRPPGNRSRMAVGRLLNENQVRTNSLVEEPTTPLGFVKQTRVQMLDFSDASMLQENNLRAKDEAVQNLHRQELERRQKLAEERKREREEKRRRKMTMSADSTRKVKQSPNMSSASPPSTSPTSTSPVQSEFPLPESQPSPSLMAQSATPPV